MNTLVLVRHLVDTQPHRHQLVVHIPCTVVCLPSLMRQEAVACEQVLWTCEPSPAKSPTLRIKAKGVALLTVSYYIQRCSPPLTGVFAGENEWVKPHGLRAVYPFGFISWIIQLALFHSKFKLRYTILKLLSTFFLNLNIYSNMCRHRIERSQWFFLLFLHNTTPLEKSRIRLG